MKNLYPKLFLIVIMIMLSGTLISQNLIHGLVTDKDSGLPIVNVQVRENRNLQATITDSLGKFTLEINEYPCILNFSHLPSKSILFFFSISSWDARTES